MDRINSASTSFLARPRALAVLPSKYSARRASQPRMLRSSLMARSRRVVSSAACTPSIAGEAVPIESIGAIESHCRRRCMWLI